MAGEFHQPLVRSQGGRHILKFDFAASQREQGFRRGFGILEGFGGETTHFGDLAFLESGHDPEQIGPQRSGFWELSTRAERGNDCVGATFGSKRELPGLGG